MKKLIILYSSNQELNEIKNSLLFDENQQINFEFIKLEFNENLANVFKRILKNSFQFSNNISNDQTSGPFDENSIYSEIDSFINLCIYCEESKSIFHIVATLFYKYASGHKMKNGNKRLSIMFVINLLRYFGYKFQYSKFDNFGLEVEKWVAKSHSLLGKDREKYIDELANWIKSNCTIALEWR